MSFLSRCCFEEAVTVLHLGSRQVATRLLLDIATTTDGEAQLLTDGFTEEEEEMQTLVQAVEAQAVLQTLVQTLVRAVGRTVGQPRANSGDSVWRFRLLKADSQKSSD